MNALTSPEGIVYGQGDHLPNATAIPEFFPAISSRRNRHSVFTNPGYPNSVLRLQNPSLPTKYPTRYEDIVQRGMAHFDLLRSFGIKIPAQRFVIGQAPQDLQPRLYTFTETLLGRNLVSK